MTMTCLYRLCLKSAAVYCALRGFDPLHIYRVLTDTLRSTVNERNDDILITFQVFKTLLEYCPSVPSHATTTIVSDCFFGQCVHFAREKFLKVQIN